MNQNVHREASCREESGVIPLPEGPLAADCHDEAGNMVYSLGAHAVAEVALWLEDEPGKTWGEWFASHWHGFVRAKLIEHFYGWRRWSCFPKQTYALFIRSSVEHMVPDERLRYVAQLFADGAENLDVLNDAVLHGDDLEPLIWLLDRIDINAVRVQLLGDHVKTLLAAAFEYSEITEDSVVNDSNSAAPTKPVMMQSETISDASGAQESREGELQ